MAAYKTDYKQLCAELVDELEGWVAYGDEIDIANAHVLIDRARAALTEPEPEGPTDEEIASILKAYAVVEPQMGVSRILHEKHFGNVARAVLARWGNHPGSPDSSTPQPVPVSERWPGAEDCDAEGMCWWWCSPAERWLRCGIPYPDQASQIHTHWLPAHALPLPHQ